jgi:glycerol-3-phosphate acyltransferase PlsY
VVWLTGYVSLGSVVAAAALPPAVWLLHPEQRGLLWLFAVLAGMIVALHHQNIRRLLSGTEHRFGRHAGKGGAP